MLKITYNAICTDCGIMLSRLGDVDNALEVLRIAYSKGWVMDEHSMFYCFSCADREHPSGLRAIEMVGPPPGFSEPELVCSCGTITKKRSGKCRKCGQELSLSP